jgi:hypothetical protein
MNAMTDEARRTIVVQPGLPDYCHLNLLPNTFVPPETIATEAHVAVCRTLRPLAPRGAMLCDCGMFWLWWA